MPLVLQSPGDIDTSSLMRPNRYKTITRTTDSKNGVNMEEIKYISRYCNTLGKCTFKNTTWRTGHENYRINRPNNVDDHAGSSTTDCDRMEKFH